MPPVATLDKCPICLNNARKSVRQDFHTKDYTVECDLCGNYTITTQLFDDIQDLIGNLRPYLTAATRQASDAGRPLTLDSENWREYAELHRHVSRRQKLDKALQLIYRKTAHPGARADFDPISDYPAADAVNAKELIFLLEHAANQGYLEKVGATQRVWTLTLDGLDYVDPTGTGGAIQGNVFVAMSFDKTLDEAFDLGIKPAIENDCGLNEAVRIDKVHHNEKICDKILAEIRRCQFVVADYTHHKGGVYFEDGFALGLGREVIRCCHADDFKTYTSTRDSTLTLNGTHLLTSENNLRCESKR